MKHYIDAEFDKHGGPLISFAIVSENGDDLYVIVSRDKASDPWVNENVIPFLDSHNCKNHHETDELTLGVILRSFLSRDKDPLFISDSIADIWYITKLLGTDHDGNYKRLNRQSVTFKVESVSAYPTKVEGLTRHNAWCDAVALKHKLSDSLVES